MPASATCNAVRQLPDEAGLGKPGRCFASVTASSISLSLLQNKRLEDSANLPDPDIIAAEIVEDLEAALSQFATMPSI